MSLPSYAHVFADGFEVQSGDPTRRTELDDGRIRQELAYPGAPETRTVRGYLESDEDMARFRGWAAGAANAGFAWRDYHDGASRQMRVIGGVGGIRYRSVAIGTVRQWEFEMTIEDVG